MLLNTPFLLAEGNKTGFGNLSNDGQLNPGDLAEVELTVTNNSNQFDINDLYGYVYATDGPIDQLDYASLYFGDISPNNNVGSKGGAKS